MVNGAGVQRTIMVIFLAMLFLMYSCVASRGVTLRARDNETEVVVRRGQNLVISLEGNPTTGYTWEATAYDQGILRQVGDPAFKPESDAIGAPGQQVFRFETLEAGQTTLQLVYHRPWETAEPEKVFAVDVLVR
jgi:inhibitor of cysteine peptidase